MSSLEKWEQCNQCGRKVDMGETLCGSCKKALANTDGLENPLKGGRR